jgi:hypothetical protein
VFENTTSAPWTVATSGPGEYWVKGPDGDVVADCSYNHYPEGMCRGNALAIASIHQMAQDRERLYQACRAVIEWAQETGAFCQEEDLAVLKQVTDAVETAGEGCEET